MDETFLKPYNPDDVEEGQLYAVMKYMDSMEVMGIEAKLPKGQSFIPVFDDYDIAYEQSENGKYQILLIEKVSNKWTKKKRSNKSLQNAKKK